MSWVGDPKHDCHVFNTWLEAANQRRVEELHLNMFCHLLNPIILSFRTLVVLKLERLYFGYDSSCVDLPLLKTLDLNYVYFQYGNSYINFISACPNLEDLHTRQICTKTIHTRDVNNAPEEKSKSLILSRLVRACVDSMDDLFNGIDNVKFLQLFIYCKASFKVIPVLPNLIHINLLFDGLLYGWDNVVKLLCHSPKLHILSIRKVCRVVSLFV